jgi:DNA-binding NtrC family response regulator
MWKRRDIREVKMDKKKDVLILDDEPIVCDRLKPALEKKGFYVEAFTESQKAIDRLKEKKFHVLVTDLKMSGPDGIDVLSYVKGHSAETQVIMISGYATIEAARASEAIGAYDFITKPFKLSDIVKLVTQAAKKSK